MPAGCRDCRKCTNAPLANLVRNVGRTAAAVATVGTSEVGMLAFKKCHICGHQLSLHQGAYSDRIQPGVSIAQQPQVVYVQQPAPVYMPAPAPMARQGPPTMPAGWYADPSDRRALCWWDGQQWLPQTKHYPNDPGAAPSGPPPTPAAVPSPAPSRPAGWYPDPADPRAKCWWDGQQWNPASKRYP